MLTDLSFLEYGKKWPPDSEQERLKTYDDNRRIFENEHSEIYRKQMRRIERVIGNFSDVISFAVIFNYQKLISIKIADLIFGEPPKITLEDDTKQSTLDEIMQTVNLNELLYQSALDVSRFADSIIMLSQSKTGSPELLATPPRHWFPVVDKANIKKILYHVFCWPYQEEKRWYLKVQIHKPDEPGVCDEQVYELLGSSDRHTIGRSVKSEEPMIDTRLNICPVFRVSNTLTTDRVFGIDDYQDIDSIVSELIVRISQISKVLDIHSNPSMSGPAGALEFDDMTQSYRLKVGNYFPLEGGEEGDARPQYLTWDASFDANFKQIELLINQLYTISEMGAAIFGDLTQKSGQVPSGSALRRLMMSPLSKAKRIRNRYDRELKAMLAACCSIKGLNIKPTDISIRWNDGLPSDPLEDAQIAQMRTGGNQTLSQWTAVKRLDNLADKDADAELEMIRQDENANAPDALEPLAGEVDE